MNTRLSWDEYFIGIAQVVSTRATCHRKHVGAVLVKDKQILATGYNGSIRGTPHCNDDNHLMEDGHCVRTVHAEANAIAQAASHGIAIGDSTVYCTALPCWPCYKLLVNSGIIEVVYAEPYRAGEHINRLLEHAAITNTMVRPVSTSGGIYASIPLTYDALVRINNNDREEAE